MTPQPLPSDSDLAGWDPASRFVALVDRIRPRFEREGLAGLNEPEHTLIALYELENEVCNGGFEQWLYQAPRELVRTTPTCMHRLSTEEGVLDLVNGIFSDIDPTAFDFGWEEWEAYLDDRGDPFWGRISACDLAFGAVEDRFIRGVWKYAENHLAAVRLP